jgi:thiol:disulfide interchange protein DsbC
MKMNKFRMAVAAGLVSMAVSQGSHAQGSAQASDSDPAGTATQAGAAMMKRLEALYPATKFGEVNPTSWPGVYEVVMGTNLAYVDATGQYFLFGHFYDMKAQRDITAERKDSLARVDFPSLPLDDALKEVRGNGKRVMAIFSDPDCPFCRQLEGGIKALTDVTIYTFLMPLESIHPGSRSKAVAIWCAKDRVATYHGVMWNDDKPRATNCANPVDRNLALGERLGIVATPTLVAADGRIMPGAAPLAQVEAWLSRTGAVQ